MYSNSARQNKVTTTRQGLRLLPLFISTMEETLILKEVLTPETYAKVVREIQRTALYADNRLPLSYVQGMVSKWEAEAYDKIYPPKKK